MSERRSLLVSAVSFAQACLNWAVPQAIAVREWAKGPDGEAFLRSLPRAIEGCAVVVGVAIRHRDEIVRAVEGVESAMDTAVLFGAAEVEPARHRLALARVTAQLGLPPSGGDALLVAVQRTKVRGTVRIGRRWVVDERGRQRQLVPEEDLNWSELRQVVRAWSWTEIGGGFRRTTRKANVDRTTDWHVRRQARARPRAVDVVNAEEDCAVWVAHESADRSRELLRLVALLSPPREAEFLRLVYRDGLTRREAARRMGIAASTARVNWKRFQSRVAVHRRKTDHV